MNIKVFVFIFFISLISSSLFSQTNDEKYIIIKADDIRKETDEWNKFFSVSEMLGIKVSAGIICNSLENANENYFSWLRKLNESGKVEFWNHGWNHKRWYNEDSVRIAEFAGTPYEYQKKHFEKSQEIMKSVLGEEPIAFGAPYNAIDETTIKVMNENKNCKLFFGYKNYSLGRIQEAKMIFKGEHDGTGKPNFEKFKADYLSKKEIQFSVIQFHPGYFTKNRLEEFKKIIEFLKLEGWKFILPKDYVK